LRAPSLLLGALVVAAACGGDDGGDETGEDLADRVVAVLEADGEAVDGSLEGAAVTCPDVDPEPGDRATCTIELAGDRQVQVDVEFDGDGAITVVAVVPG
jgi:hypothetical protein